MTSPRILIFLSGAASSIIAVLGVAVFSTGVGAAISVLVGISVGMLIVATGYYLKHERGT